ncbi:MAG: class I SAM-dependent RNA methyltransferase [Oscillospiraceae bacterium]|nr:class I SAM-dependent RNA methyltransferase [Oscillospiraceae bacterium]MCL2126412.1 class I SAM-dependent RNA methyltransferase [Oscillospiraceae bacterium]
MEFTFSVPCLFGVEGLCADELRRIGMADVRAENGRVLFAGSAGDIARANINLRTGERVLLIVGTTAANSYDELFEGVRAMGWERFIPFDGKFPVKGHSLDSKLHSIPDCQSIIKKAIAESLKVKYKVDWMAESGAKYQVRFSIMDNIATLSIDTTGDGLHKRGYRPVSNAAPLRETLAAAIVKLSRYRGREPVCDPFCGSGTIPIEAALAALNRAPGLNRGFSAQSWAWQNKSLWDDAIAEARAHEYRGKYDIWGGDIDRECIDIAKENAKRAGVAEHIRFECSDAASFRRDAPGGILMSNPPYGERIMQQSEAEDIYRRLGAVSKQLEKWKIYILSSHAEFERAFGMAAVKKRKLYNGMIKCDLYMYF